MEIRPSIEWDKGHALEYLLDTLGLSNSTDVLPLYIGDDRTDEDAFKVSFKTNFEATPFVLNLWKSITIAFIGHSLHGSICFL